MGKNINTLLNDKVWNFLFSVIFFSLSILAWRFVEKINIYLSEIKVFDLFIIALATYRLTRLLIYDEIFYFIKDYIRKFKEEQGFVKSAYVLFNCPWCVGVWAALITLITYILFPFGKFLIVVLAISALSSFFHLIITWLGWLIDEKKSFLKNKNHKESESPFFEKKID